MTDKRFIVKNIMFDGDCIVDTTDDGYYTTDKQDLENLCELLNELHDEKQSQSIVIKGYQDRNEILNQEICDKNKILLTEIEIGEKLHDENNRIKQTIHDMMETERTELGKSVLKQLYEAIQ